MSKPVFLLLFVFLALSSVCDAQNTGILTGTVMDSTGKPLSEVTIILGNSTTGAFTGKDGSYAIPVPAGQTIQIHFSYLGYETRTYPIVLKRGEHQELNIVMKSKTY